MDTPITPLCHRLELDSRPCQIPAALSMGNELQYPMSDYAAVLKFYALSINGRHGIACSVWYVRVPLFQTYSLAKATDAHDHVSPI